MHRAARAEAFRPSSDSRSSSRGRDDQGLHLVNGLDASLYSRALGALEHADHLDSALTRLGGGVGYSSQHRTRCHLRVGGVALTLPVPSRPVRPVDLDDGKAATRQESGKSGAIGTSALDPEGTNLTQLSGPPFELPIPVSGRWGGTLGETHTLLVNGNGHVLVLVSIDTDDHLHGADDFANDDCCHFCLLKE